MNSRKETSVLFLFRPSFRPGAARRRRRPLIRLRVLLLFHSGAVRSPRLLRSHPPFFLLDSFVLEIFFDEEAVSEACTFLLPPFHLPDRTVQTDLFSPLSLSLFFLSLVTEVAGSFSASLELFLKGGAQSGAYRTHSRDISRLNLFFFSVFRIATQTNAIINAK